MATMTRSNLEQKPRDELDIIARAMGGKPSSKARKAEIVDLIMELVDFDDSATATQTSSDSDSATAISPDSADPTSPDSTDPTAESTHSQLNPNRAKATSQAPLNGAFAVKNAALDEDAAATTSSTSPSRSPRQSRARSTNSSDMQTFSYSTREAGQSTKVIDETADQDGDSGVRMTGSDGSMGSASDFSGDTSNRRRRRRVRNQADDQTSTMVEAEGYLDLRDEGYGFLRVNGHLSTKSDIYVSVKQVKQFGLRKGDHVKGTSRPSGQNEKNPALLKIDQVNHRSPELAKNRPEFEDLTPLFPDVRLQLEREGDPQNMTTRIVDLLSPIGKGQRGLIVSPPKAGKTTIMKEIARSIELNNPEVVLLVLLVDERPEEVTDMRRWLKRPTSEVVASTFDRPASEHTYIAELVIERAKRLVEDSQDVVIILDGITRLARAYNQALPGTGRLMSGGMDAGSLYPPKKFFGAARNVEEGGSLTILGTALVETGSKMDEVIFEEFKGTGNLELRLDRRSAERRIYPAIDVDASSTRHEELLFERDQLQQVWKLRRVLSGLASENDGNGAAGLELLIDRLRQFPSNSAFLSEVAQGQMRT